MPKKKVFKEVKKLTKKEEDWLIGEFSYVSQLKTAIDKKDKKTAERIFRRMGIYEQRLNSYHQRLLKAIEAAKQADLSPQETAVFDYIKSKIVVFEAEMQKDLSRFRGEVPDLLANNNWDALKKLYPKIEQGIKAWYALDKQLVTFEDRLYNSNTQSSDIVYKIVRELEANPDLIRSPSYMRKALNVLVRCKDSVKIFKERVKTVYKIGSVTIKTILLGFFFYIYANYVNPFLKPTEYNQVIDRIEMQLNSRDILQKYLDSMPQSHKQLIIKTYLKDNKYIIEQQLGIVINEYAKIFYNQMIDQAYASYAPNVKIVVDAARNKPNMDISRIRPNRTRQDIENEFIRGIGKNSREDVIADIAKGLRNYYILDIVEGRLPSFLEFLADVKHLDVSDVFYDLCWGATQPATKIKIEDMIRKRLNVYLEPGMNEIKKSINIPNTIWTQVKKTVINVVTNPSKAQVYLDELYNTALKIGGGMAVITLVLIISGILPTVYMFYRIMIRNYIRDVIYLSKRAKALLKVKR